MSDERFMKLAIKEAKKGDLPFGAIIVKDSKVIALAHNTINGLDPTAHSEINVIKEACLLLNTKDLSGCTLYSTAEPCPMCFTAMWWTKISRLVYGTQAEDIREKEWKIEIKCSYLNDHSGNRIKIKGGLLRKECLKLLEE